MIELSKEPTKPKADLSKEDTEKETEKLKNQIFDLQNEFYAEKKHSMLVVLQGMDAAGKDGTVRHVFSCANPMGITVMAFKAPTEEEQEHDFLWRIHKHTPALGMIQVFNRSHYEDILVPSVHETIDKDVLKRRYDEINSFEQMLQDSGTVFLKFFLHISKKEQDERIKERLTRPEKRWKYDPADKREAANWDAYEKVYEKIFEKCSANIPWKIIPADHKWYRNYLIAKEMVDTLKGLKMKYPK